jgi:maleate cis-trans isomerase
MVICEEVSKDVVSISTISSNMATTYSSLYAFGNHLQVASAKSLMSG